MMKDITGSRKLTAVLMGFIFIMFGIVALMSVRCFDKKKTSLWLPVLLNGTYSADGGTQSSVRSTDDIDFFFKTITFRGNLPEAIQQYPEVVISGKNVWFSLKKADGTVVVSHTPADSKRDDTPGFRTAVYDTGKDNSFSYDEVYTFEITYPYEQTANYTDCISVYLCETNGLYRTFFFDAVPLLLIFLIVCFIGVFVFPTAAFILGTIDYKYLAFGVLCFFWGSFMITESVSDYMNLWITEPVVCLALSTLTNYFLVASIFFYFKANLKGAAVRSAANLICVVYVLFVLFAMGMHIGDIGDLHSTMPLMYLITIFCFAAISVLLLVEVRSNSWALSLLISWIPLSLSVMVDIVDHYMHFIAFTFSHVGLAFTMVYQIVRVVLDLLHQHKEVRHHDKMEKELYEAKVSVMVSQIQPHFLYNSLSSIAMLCKLDPATAYEATITFAQYLRSNMDSLKQTTPIPFEQELEHLKKYLYIEKLRFGKKLNIEYDIEDTAFELPQLSIQPLAENAVKHGISKKPGGGTLTIATRETEDAHLVIISDDGTGFDVNDVKNDGRSHIGMENIKKRLAEMCNATVDIKSVIGEGTVATITIPKVKEQPQT